MTENLIQLAKTIPGVVYQFRVEADGDWRFCYLSEGITQLYEATPEQAYADHNILTERIHEDDRASHRASVEQATKTLSPWKHEHRIRTRSGEIKWVKAQAVPFLQNDGSVLWSGLLVDITENKNTEKALFRAKRIYSALIEANRIIDIVSDASQLFQEICRIAVEFGDMKMAWVGSPDKLDQRIVPVSRYGEGTAYLDEVLISIRPDIAEGQGPTGITFREGRTTIVQDFLEAEMTRPWHDPGQHFGWGSSATFPIFRGRHFYAVLTVYNAEKNAFDCPRRSKWPPCAD